MDPRHVITVRPRIKPKRGLVHLTPGGIEGAGLTLCGLRCDGWTITDDAPSCRRCNVRHELNLLPSVEEHEPTEPE